VSRVTELDGALGEVLEGYESLEAEMNASPNELQAKLTELQRDIWTRDKKAEFAKYANEAKVRPEAHDDLWSLLGIDPDKDAECDSPCMQERISEAVKARGYLLKSDAETASGAAGAAQGQPTGKPALAARDAGIGMSRGAPERGQGAAATVADKVNAAFAGTGRTDSYRIA
jgi:hypothetical protein